MLLTTLAFAQGMANIMENLDYQIVGILVVMMCLGGPAVILTIAAPLPLPSRTRPKPRPQRPPPLPLLCLPPPLRQQASRA